MSQYDWWTRVFIGINQMDPLQTINQKNRRDKILSQIGKASGKSISKSSTSMQESKKEELEEKQEEKDIQENIPGNTKQRLRQLK